MVRSVRDVINEGQIGKLPNALEQCAAGTLFSCVPRFIRATVASNKIVLPENAKAAVVLACYVTAGTVNGRFSAVFDSTPATTQVSVDPTGDLVFFADDAVTEAEVHYVAHEGQVFEDVIQVASNSGAPLSGRKIQVLLEAESLAGTATGALTVQDRGASAASTKAQASLTGAAVGFHATQGVTKARIKYIACPGQGTAKPSLGARLDAASGN